MATVRTTIHITEELRAALDHASGEDPLTGFVERLLWRAKAVKDAAAEIGVENPKRPMQNRGIWDRKTDDAKKAKTKRKGGE